MYITISKFQISEIPIIVNILNNPRSKNNYFTDLKR